MPVVIEAFPDPYLPQTCKPHKATMQRVATDLTRMGTGCLGLFEVGGWAGFLFTDPLKLPIELGPEAWEAIFSLGPTHIALGLKDPSILPTTSGLFLVWDGDIATKWRQAYFMSRTRGLPAPAADVVQSSEKSSKDVQNIGSSKPLRQLTTGTPEAGVTLAGPNRDPDTIILDGAGGGESIYRVAEEGSWTDILPNLGYPEPLPGFPVEPITYQQPGDLVDQEYPVVDIDSRGRKSIRYVPHDSPELLRNRRTRDPLPAPDNGPDTAGPGTTRRTKGGSPSRKTPREDRGT